MGTLKLKKQVVEPKPAPEKSPPRKELFWLLWREDTTTVTQKCYTYAEVHAASQSMQERFPEGTFWIMEMKKKVRNPVAARKKSEQNENASTTSQ